MQPGSRVLPVQAAQVAPPDGDLAVVDQAQVVAAPFEEPDQEPAGVLFGGGHRTAVDPRADGHERIVDRNPLRGFMASQDTARRLSHR